MISFNISQYNLINLSCVWSPFSFICALDYCGRQMKKKVRKAINLWKIFLSFFQSNSFEMNNERQPLLLSNESEQCSPRPDLRSSPENFIVDGTEESKNLDGNKINKMKKYNLPLNLWLYWNFSYLLFGRLWAIQKP